MRRAWMRVVLKRRSLLEGGLYWILRGLPSEHSRAPVEPDIARHTLDTRRALPNAPEISRHAHAPLTGTRPNLVQ